MELWHGSNEIVKKPDLAFCRDNNDYGRAFYTTEYLELAREWACPGTGRDGFASHYELEVDGLNVLDLDEEDYSALKWLSVLLSNRIVHLDAAIAVEASGWIRENYPVDLTGFDVVCGYRADDSYFSFARQFVSNSLSVAQLSWAMHLGGLGRQIALRTPKALQQLEFTGYVVAPARIYYSKRCHRDLGARRAFAAGPGFDPKGIYMNDLISGRVGPYDERLR